MIKNKGRYTILNPDLAYGDMSVYYNYEGGIHLKNLLRVSLVFVKQSN